VHRNMNLLFYPIFKDSDQLTDHYYRLMWYLNPIYDKINKIYLPIVDELKINNIPGYLDKKIEIFESKFKKKIEFVVANEDYEIFDYVNKTDVLLLWKIDRSDGDWFPSSPIKKILKTKKMYRVDHYNEQFAGSFYLKISAELSGDDEELLNECKTKFAGIDTSSFKRKGYIFGTGPSLSLANNYDFSDGTSIACNSMVKNDQLLDKLNPPIIVISDPIFHAGCSSYAGEFREYLEHAMHKYNSYLIVPMRDYRLYMSNLDSKLRDKIIGVPFVSESKPNLNLYNKFVVTSTGNVLTLFLLPLAATFFEEINILGCDGRPLNENDYFWKHDPSSQLVNKMEEIQVAHPGFFNINYDDYYYEHCNTLEKWLDEIERTGKFVSNLTPSYIPALNKRSRNLIKQAEDSNLVETTPLVSIIMPAFNEEKYIVEAIQSVQQQSYTNWELLIIDDHSTDQTWQVVEKAMCEDGRIKLYRNKGKGVSAARNMGLDLASGKYITFLDSDDIFYSDALKKRVDYLEKNSNHNVVYCETHIVDETLRGLNWYLGKPEIVTYKNMSGNPVMIFSVMGRSQIMKMFRFESGLTNGEDWLYLAQILRTGETMYKVKGCAVAYRLNNQSTVRKDFISHENKLIQVIDWIYSDAPDDFPAAQEFRRGLKQPKKEYVIARRRVGLLTWLILSGDTQNISNLVKEIKAYDLRCLKQQDIVMQIQHTSMRFFVCRDNEYKEKIRAMSQSIKRTLYECEIDKVFPLFALELTRILDLDNRETLRNVRKSGTNYSVIFRLKQFIKTRHITIFQTLKFFKWAARITSRKFMGVGGVAALIILGLFLLSATAPVFNIGFAIGGTLALLLYFGGLVFSYCRDLINQKFSSSTAQFRNNLAQLRQKLEKRIDESTSLLHKIQNEFITSNHFHDYVLQKEVEFTQFQEQVDSFKHQVLQDLGRLKDDIKVIKEDSSNKSIFFQNFNRAVGQEVIVDLQENWLPKLGLSLSGRALYYMSHRIKMVENICIGRMASSIETALIRSLTARSVKAERLDVLEIGTLFGVGVAAIYDNCIGFFNDVHITVIDPLNGYYRKDQTDIVTNIPITRKNFEINMTRLGIPPEDYDIIQEKSCNESAVEVAGKRLYDILIIDGDHSRSGVKQDFLLYRGFVKEYGYIIFDDYGAEEWPEIKKYVDDEVMSHENLQLVGTGYRSAVFRVIKAFKDK